MVDMHTGRPMWLVNDISMGLACFCGLRCSEGLPDTSDLSGGPSSSKPALRTRQSPPTQSWMPVL